VIKTIEKQKRMLRTISDLQLIAMRNQSPRVQSLHALCEDYRAAATIDLEHDKADLSTKVQCPLLPLWGGKGAMERLYDVKATWKRCAANVRGKALPGGRWLPKRLPNEVHSELLIFLS
jgi:haloacetate dehalogenase